MTLPAPDITYNCAVCGYEMSDDPNHLHCPRCGLTYPSPSSAATFTDPDASRCGNPYADVNPQVVRSKMWSPRGTGDTWHILTTVFESCGLPAGHRGFHYYPATSTSSLETA